MAMMASLQRRLEQHSTSDHERPFYSHSIQCLSVASGGVIVELDRWTITSFEVEFGQKIGSGGLCGTYFLLYSACSFLVMCSGEVFIGTWNMTPVAFKVLKTEQGIIPNTPVRHMIVYLYQHSSEHQDDASRDRGWLHPVQILASC
jgi:hypothetical protein